MFARDLHHIQQEIITSLAYRSPQRFSQLQPPRIPNNTFSYHLKKLLQLGYITLSEGGYIATRKALKTLQYEGSTTKRGGAPALITIIYVTNDDNKVLLLQRNNRPFVGWYGIPSGLVHQNEKLADAALRELNEKTTLESEKMKFAGVLDFKYLEKDSGDLFVHAVGFVYTHHIKGNTDHLSGLETKYGTLQWSNLDDSRVLPEVQTVAELVGRSDLFIESIDYDEPLN